MIVKDKSKKIICKNCPYYTGIVCHGLGDFWGECTLIRDTPKILSRFVGVSQFDIYYKGDNYCPYNSICYDDTECHLFEVVTYETK